jgi:MFS family permease
VGVLATASCACLIVFALSPNVVLALALLALAGAFGAYQITVSATFNTIVPNEIRGGAFGVIRSGLRVSQGIGVAVGGAVAQALGSATATIALAGVAGVLIAVPATIAWARQNRAEAALEERAPDTVAGTTADGKPKQAGGHPEASHA